MSGKAEVEPPATVDASRLHWAECRCGGHVAQEGKNLYHDEPACEQFRQLVLEGGGRLARVKDVSCS